MRQVEFLLPGKPKKERKTMEKIESFKPIDPTKIKSPSVARRMSTNSGVLGGRGQFMLRLVRLLQFSIDLEINFLFSFAGPSKC